MSRLRNAWLPVLALATACVDNPLIAPPEPLVQRQELHCQAQVRAETIRCSVVPAGPRANIILGGQGINVRLISTGVSFDDFDNILSADVAIQNLLDQPLGTDGSSSYGAKVFFQTGPTTTVGTGNVDVANEDGEGAFTGSNQPYFEYNETIQPRGISSDKRWEFSLDETVEAFVFTVLVETQIPAELSVLHWQLEAGTPVYFATFSAVWAGAPHQVFAVGQGGVIMHFDGNYWRAFETGCSCIDFYGVFGFAANDVYAVGSSGGIAHFDGSTWEVASDPDIGTEYLSGVWGSNTEDVWVVGTAGTILHGSGSDWVSYTDSSLTTQDLLSVWGSADDDVWAVGTGGTILHWDGSSWTAATSPVTGTLSSIHGGSANDIWAVGSDCPCGPSTVVHWNGTDWTESTDPDLEDTGLVGVWTDAGGEAWAVGASILHYVGGNWVVVEPNLELPLFGISGTSSTNVFAAGGAGAIQRYAGGSWGPMTMPTPTLYSVSTYAGQGVAVGEGGTILQRSGGVWSAQTTGTTADLYGVWGSQDYAWAVGEGGTILRSIGGVSWSDESGATSEDLNAVWGRGNTIVIAVGTNGTILERIGNWGVMSSPTSSTLYGVWFDENVDIFLVGADGTILRGDGSEDGWNAMNSGVATTLKGVWGSSPSNVYAVGESGVVLHYDGNPEGDWTTVSTPADPSGTINAVWGTSANDVFVLANDGLNILHWDGSSWQTMTALSSEADSWLYSIGGTGPHDLFAVGDLGMILHGHR